MMLLPRITIEVGVGGGVGKKSMTTTESLKMEMETAPTVMVAARRLWIGGYWEHPSLND